MTEFLMASCLVMPDGALPAAMMTMLLPRLGTGMASTGASAGAKPSICNEALHPEVL